MCWRTFTTYKNCTRRNGTYKYIPCDTAEQEQPDQQYEPPICSETRRRWQMVPKQPIACYGCTYELADRRLNRGGQSDCNLDFLLEKLRLVAKDRKQVEDGVEEAEVGWSLPYSDGGSLEVSKRVMKKVMRNAVLRKQMHDDAARSGD